MNDVPIVMFLCHLLHPYLKLEALCCNPVPGDLLSVRAGLITSRDPLGDGGSAESPRGRQEPICERQELAAVVNFNFGISCGKRDSRSVNTLNPNLVPGCTVKLGAQERKGEKER